MASSFLIALSILVFGFTPSYAAASKFCENLWHSAHEPLSRETLFSKRLELKVIGVERADDTFAIWNHPDVGGLFAPGRTLSRNNIVEYLSDPAVRNYGLFHIGSFPAKNLMGTASVRPTYTKLETGVSRVDVSLSIAIHPAYSRQGLATEALERIIQHVLRQENVETVNADVFIGNEASVAVFQKLGFYEGRSGDRNTRRFTLSKWGRAR